MNGFRLTVLFSITTIILLSNSVVSRLIPIKNAWKVSDDTILECKVFNGAISKCHVKYEPANIYKFTRNTLPASSFKPTTTSITTLMPSKEQLNRGGWRYKRPRDGEDRRNRHHNYPILWITPKILPTVAHCKCSNFFCKLYKFIGLHLNGCNKHKKGILQKSFDIVKDGVGKLLDKAKLGKRLVNTVVDSIVKTTKVVIKSVCKVGKTIYKGVSKAAEAVTSVITNK